MIVPKRHIASILQGSRKTALLPLKGKLGKTAHIRHSEGEFVCRVQIGTITEVDLDGLTDADANEAGFKSINDFRDEWCKVHGVAWTGEKALRVEFARIPEREHLFLLRERGSGYTEHPSQAMKREPEAVDPETVKAGVTSLEARQRFAMEQVERDCREWSGSLGERLDRVLAESKRVGLDVSGLEWGFRRKVEQLEHRKKKAA